MGFLNHDHQRARFPLAVAAVFVGHLFPGIANAAGKQVGHQQIVQVAFVLAEGQHDVLAGFQRMDDLLQAVGGGFFHHVGQVEDPAQFIVQALGGSYVHAHIVGPGRHAARGRELLAFFVFDGGADLHGFEGVEPALPPETLRQGRQGGGGGLAEVQLAHQQLDVFRLDVAFAQLQVEIGLAAADAGAAAQPDHAYLSGELGAQADHALVGIRGGIVVTVFVVHIQHQHRGAAMVDQAGQDDAGEEGFAGACGAENPGRALHEFFKVDTDRVALLARAAHHEITLLGRVAKDFGHVAGFRQAHGGVVRGHSFHRQWTGVIWMGAPPLRVARRAQIWPAFQHERRQHLQVGVEGLPVQQGGQPGGRRVSLCSSAKRGSVAPSCRSVTRP